MNLNSLFGDKYVRRDHLTHRPVALKQNLKDENPLYENKSLFEKYLREFLNNESRMMVNSVQLNRKEENVCSFAKLEPRKITTKKKPIVQKFD